MNNNIRLASNKFLLPILYSRRTTGSYLFVLEMKDWNHDAISFRGRGRDAKCSNEHMAIWGQEGMKVFQRRLDRNKHVKVHKYCQDYPEKKFASHMCKKCETAAKLS